jgi:hypothetical protein
MLKYGKRKASLLPSFSTIRDASAMSRSRSSKKQGKYSCMSSLDLTSIDALDAFLESCALLGANIFYCTGSTALETVGRPHISNPIASRHDNSVDEMASMLLDDTTTLLGPTKRVAVKHVESPQDKDLPQIPKLLFNADDAWPHRTAPVDTAAGDVNAIKILDGSEVADNSMSHIFGQSADHSTPPIPRRVSGPGAFIFVFNPSSQVLQMLCSRTPLRRVRTQWNFTILSFHSV